MIHFLLLSLSLFAYDNDGAKSYEGNIMNMEVQAEQTSVETLQNTTKEW